MHEGLLWVLGMGANREMQPRTRMHTNQIAESDRFERFYAGLSMGRGPLEVLRRGADMRRVGIEKQGFRQMALLFSWSHALAKFLTGPAPMCLQAKRAKMEEAVGPTGANYAPPALANPVLAVQHIAQVFAFRLDAG